MNGGLKTTTVAAGDTVTFSLNVSASGQARNVVVTDTLPAGFQFVSSNGATCSQSGQVLTCDVGTLGSASGPLPGPNPCAAKEKFYVFEYNDSDVVGIDTGCGTSNDVTTPIAPKLHISCSDMFPGGVPQKSDLGDPNRRVAAFYITSDKKTCGSGTFTPPTPASLTITIKATVQMSGCNIAKVVSSNDSNAANNESQACVNVPVPPDSGYLEICESAASGTFTFKLSNGTTVSVPAGSCSAPMQVPTGPITIVQDPKDCWSLTNVVTFPPPRG